MRFRTNIMTSLTVVSLAGLTGLACGSSDGGGGGTSCGDLGTYTATATTSSFATDVYPILSNTNGGQFGCGQTLICHGDPPQPIDTANMMTLKFTDDAATVYATLTQNSINDPTMKRVTPGDLTNSFLAYKVSDKATLACLGATGVCTGMVNSSNGAKCGDPMPSIGTLAPADRTKILDWIKLGAMP